MLHNSRRCCLLLCFVFHASINLVCGSHSMLVRSFILEWPKQNQREKTVIFLYCAMEMQILLNFSILFFPLLLISVE